MFVIETQIFAILFLTAFSSWFPAVSGVPRQRRGRNVTRHIEDGTIRLMGGQLPSEGNVEIFHAGVWGSICDDEWDNREASIVCKILGFSKAVRPTHNSEFGRGRRVIWMDNIYCSGDEEKLEDCKFDGWGVHDCTSTESAGVVCDGGNVTKVNPRRTIVATRSRLGNLQDNFIQVRLKNGRNQFEGRVEIKLNKNSWGLVCGDGWSLLEATVVCRHLGFGYGQAALQSSYFGGQQENIVLSGLKCTGKESELAHCFYEMVGRVFCPGKEENIAGVICAENLPDLVPDEGEVERSTYLEDRQLLYLQCAMEENCLASGAYESLKNDYAWHYEQRRLLRFTARIGNVGTADFRPFRPKHDWQWHMCHLHYHSMEVFAHFDVINMQGQKVAEGHKASFCLEDSSCISGADKKFNCASYGDQGISVGCTDTYLHNIDCQWVDITDLPPGMYQFKFSINPELKVPELRYDNNAVLCSMYYNAVAVRITNCTLTGLD